MPQSSTFPVMLSKKYKRGADDDVFVSLMLPKGLLAINEMFHWSVEIPLLEHHNSRHRRSDYT